MEANKIETNNQKYNQESMNQGFVMTINAMDKLLYKLTKSRERI